MRPQPPRPPPHLKSALCTEAVLTNLASASPEGADRAWGIMGEAHELVFAIPPFSLASLIK